MSMGMKMWALTWNVEHDHDDGDDETHLINKYLIQEFIIFCYLFLYFISISILLISGMHTHMLCLPRCSTIQCMLMLRYVPWL